jgi:ribosomal protein S18 acetylase RimI-like enzyme
MARFPAAAQQVVLLGARAVGALASAREARILHLLEIALLAPWRGRGIGSVVLEHLFREADGEGLALRLSVYRSNPRADALYRRLGFAEVDGDELMFTLERPAACR